MGGVENEMMIGIIVKCFLIFGREENFLSVKNWKEAVEYWKEAVPFPK